MAMSRLGSLMGTGAQRYNRRYSGGMPWWQQMLIMEAAKPVVSGVIGFAGEGAKQLFLGKHAQGLMEDGQGKTIRRKLGKKNLFDKEHGAERVRLQGKYRDMPTGIWEQHILPSIKQRWKEDHGPITDKTRKKWEDYLTIIKPEGMKLANKDAYEFENLQTFDTFPKTDEELQRRLLEGKDWWSMSTGARMARKAKNVITGNSELTTQQQKEGLLSLFVGKDSPEYQAYLDDPKRYEAFMSGKEMEDAIKALRSTEILTTNEEIYALMKKFPYGDKSAKRYAQENVDIDLYTKIIDEQLAAGVHENKGYGSYLLKERAADETTMRNIVRNLPYNLEPEERKRVIENTLRRSFYKTLVPNQTFLTNNAEPVLNKKVMGDLTEHLNQSYSRYGVGGAKFVVGTKKRTDGERAVPIATLAASDNDQDIADYERIITKRKEIITRAANRFPDNLNSVLDKSAMDMSLPLADKIQINNNMFPLYMDAMLSADNIVTVTDSDTGVFSVKIKDMTKGQSAIEKFLIDLKPDDSQRPTTKGGQTLTDRQNSETANNPENESTVEPTDSDPVVPLTISEDVLKEGFRLGALDSKRQEEISKELKNILSTQITPLLKDNRNMEGLNDASQVIADYFIEQKDKYGFSGFNSVAYEKAGKIRTKLAATYGINETSEDSFRMMRDLLAPKPSEVPLLKRDFKGTGEEFKAVRDHVLSNNPTFKGSRLNIAISNIMGTKAYGAVPAEFRNAPDTVEDVDVDTALAKQNGNLQEVNILGIVNEEGGTALQKSVLASSLETYIALVNEGMPVKKIQNIMGTDDYKIAKLLLQKADENDVATDTENDSLLSSREQDKNLRKKREQAIIEGATDAVKSILTYTKSNKEIMEERKKFRKQWQALKPSERTEYGGDIDNFIAAMKKQP